MRLSYEQSTNILYGSGISHYWLLQAFLEVHEENLMLPNIYLEMKEVK